MADACTAGQRNLYPRKDGTRFTWDYRDGRGMTYSESLKKLSWPWACAQAEGVLLCL